MRAASESNAALEIMWPVNVFRVLQATKTLNYLVQIQRSTYSVFYLSIFKRRLPYHRSASFLEKTKSVSTEALEHTESCDFRTRTPASWCTWPEGISWYLILTFVSSFINSDHCESWCRYSGRSLLVFLSALSLFCKEYWKVVAEP